MVRPSPLLLRFAANGLMATAVHFAALALLLDGLHLGVAGIANGIAATAGIAASYLGNRALVFRSSASHASTLPGFLLLYGLVALLHAGVLALWSDAMHLPYQPGFVLGTALAFGLTYAGNRRFVFRAARG